MSGKVVTFYSYKGGTGRTFALANVASFLAEREEGKILVIDWDLDSPGLHRYFQPYIENDRKSSGLIELFDILNNEVSTTEIDSIFKDWNLSEFITEVNLAFPDGKKYAIDFMPAGKLDENYAEKVRRFRWDKLWDKTPHIFSSFAKYLSEQYKWILIDSRTGFTITSSICTMLMPSRLVMVFTPNKQSLEGIKDLTHRAAWARRQNVDLRPFEIFPLPSRVEVTEETRRRLWRYGSQESNIEGFQPQFKQLFQDIYDLEDSDLDLDSYFDEVQIQQTSRYAYGEEIAALVEKLDRFSLARSYETFVNIFLDNSFPWEVSIPNNRMSPELSTIEANSGLSSSLRKSGDWLGALIAIFKAAKKLRQLNLQENSDVPSSISRRTIDRLRSLLKLIPEKNRLEGHGDDVLSLDIVSNQNKIIIASASQDRTVKLWDVNGYEEKSFYWNSTDKLKICDVAISPDASLIAMVSSRGELRLLERDSKRNIFSVELNRVKLNRVNNILEPYLFRVCFATSGKLILTSSPVDKNLKIWNLEGDLQRNIEHDDAILGIDFDSTNQLIASVSKDNKLRIWDLEGNIRHCFPVENHKNLELVDVSFDSTGSKVAVACLDSTVRIWQLDSEAEMPISLSKTYRERKFNVYSSSFSPSGKYVAAACEDGLVRIFNISDRKVVVRFEGHNDEVRVVKFISEELILSGGGDNAIRLWKFKQENQSNEIEEENDLDYLLDQACQWLDDYLRSNRNLDLSDRYICTDI